MTQTIIKINTKPLLEGSGNERRLNCKQRQKRY